jgi:CRISPR/Cas system CMR subunit Cmr4 (Cas7 group RAMP superfamily)
MVYQAPSNSEGVIMSPETFELTFEQEFQMRLIEEQTTDLSREQMENLLLQTSRLLMVKDDVIRSLVKQQLECEFLS